ncbi:N-acetylglucosaminyl-phosphatidylinositol biosynthetic protein, putative [Trypanosoma brucei gambiense DAL972]|uniref:phosphatidylinositol N-acetylglucosaminyltransferase n=1 Tax=Trypanosoma brucei gambiense (strain MHOM/CI/86/DAL972) TaxID=679716 RepID=C9ZIV8_TRYB9|nr:N-acetylglucosaminyl-phosphatidylinositol biosynthetic protein, putative [Trypanosoma brucei gambiense DAL972]CBH09324.1 N-acetylglucosaminyl-phosphatidylinositol biosynthetic protein, putative [Trypanosoma brucei gambiense DAL972]|eukprot:XP_011771632.1 N-acetylglucosaminyl-phosphatidylinositol biosynthetic protein, putative [Trypanosoma brucei gambiense DAL972]
MRRHRVAVVSDFFYPGFGGVEVHIYSLGQCLMRRGHKVIVITRAYGDTCGVRYLTNGMKVYYLPLMAVKLPAGSVTLPTMYLTFATMRSIFIRERITVVHGHQNTSNLCHEALFHAGTLGLKTCFTDHSLFGFADVSSIHINKVCEWSLRNVDQVICVSNTSRENTVLRAKIDPQRVSVIPNATDCSFFTPPDDMKYKSWASKVENEGLTIVVIGRLVYRKGSDLFVDVIPEICKRHPNIRWIVGGDGPRRSQFQQMIERHDLMDRVKMLGSLPHSGVRNVLIQGQIFLNCSLTEAFCIALIEAASCGLLCVSTRVGGVPEVLPPNMLLLAEPDPSSIITTLEEAIASVPYISPWELHDNVRRFYRWDWVAERTERVYDKIMCTKSPSLYERLMNYASVGCVYGVICWLLCIGDWLMLTFLEFWFPSELIDIAPDFPLELYSRNREKLQVMGSPS